MAGLLRAIRMRPEAHIRIQPRGLPLVLVFGELYAQEVADGKNRPNPQGPGKDHV